VIDETIKVFCDGGSRGNPGPAAYGFNVVDQGVNLYSGSGYLGVTTNNVAEYGAVIAALNWIYKNMDRLGKEIVFVLDSELVVKQINGNYKVKDSKLKELNLEVKELLNKIERQIIFTNVTRENNQVADGLVNYELDKKR